MQRLEFLVEGSKGDEYEVVFEREGQNLNGFCTCEAGQNGLYCKHRFSLMDGDITALLSGNGNDVTALKKLISGTDVEAAYKMVLETEKAYETVKAELKEAKKALARAMYR